MDPLSYLIALIAFGVGLAIAYGVKWRGIANKGKLLEDQAAKVVEEARLKAENLVKEAKLEVKDRLLRMKTEFETETRDVRLELTHKEKRLLQKEESIENKAQLLEGRERDLAKSEQAMAKKEADLAESENHFNRIIQEQKAQLERISGLTADQAKELLIKAMENEARYEAAKMIKRIENETREEADKKAKKIISTAIQRYAGDFVAERTVSVVPLPSDEMKGRIIGREGRNIRALEAATGIDLIIDDTPEAVILSGFNPVRREVARLSLMKLIADGRIHPARIEDVVKKVELEVDLVIKEAGEQAAFDLGDRKSVV